jgi:hypothetical protein
MRVLKYKIAEQKGVEPLKRLATFGRFQDGWACQCPIAPSGSERDRIFTGV